MKVELTFKDKTSLLENLSLRFSGKFLDRFSLGNFHFFYGHEERPPGRFTRMTPVVFKHAEVGYRGRPARGLKSTRRERGGSERARARLAPSTSPGPPPFALKRRGARSTRPTNERPRRRRWELWIRWAGRARVFESVRARAWRPRRTLRRRERSRSFRMRS